MSKRVCACVPHHTLQSLDLEKRKLIGRSGEDGAVIIDRKIVLLRGATRRLS
jgi:hypothetical protein